MRGKSKLQTAVEDELRWEPNLDSESIRVSITDGVVTLDGHVPSFAAKRLAETSAKRVAGVRGVANELAVKLPTSAYRDDTDIALAVADSLKWNNLIAG